MSKRDDELKKQVWGALFKHDGDRAKAAEEMDVSLRTFTRYLAKFDMYVTCDKMGWTKQQGPPRGTAITPRHQDYVRARIAATGGELDLGAVAIDLYGTESASNIDKVLKILESIGAKYDGKLWKLELT